MVYHPFRHLGLKVLSVAIAVLLWLAVAGEQVVERSLLAPLELQGKPERLELIGLPPATVDVRVRGPSSILGRLAATDVVAVIDLSTAKPGHKYFPLSPDQIRVAPFGVEVTQVSPATLALDLENSETRVVPVVPTVEGRPAEGFLVDQVTVEPAAVQVAGPETAVRALRHVQTEPISIAGLSRSLKESASIGLQAPGLQLKSARSAVVTVAIVPAPVEQVLSNVPVRMRNVPSRLSAAVSPLAVRVVARGPKAAFDGGGTEPVSAFVDLAGLGAGRHTLRVSVEAAQTLQVLRIEPAAVRVTLR